MQINIEIHMESRERALAVYRRIAKLLLASEYEPRRKDLVVSFVKDEPENLDGDEKPYLRIIPRDADAPKHFSKLGLLLEPLGMDIEFLQTSGFVPKSKTK